MNYIENKTEEPNTFYIEEENNYVKVVITFKNWTQHVDYPVQYADGSFGWDFPERVPNEVMQAVHDRFTVDTEEEID